MEAVHTVRIDHAQATAMPFQRQTVNHRPSPSPQNELYKPSRSPLSSASRYPYPASPQIQTSAVNQQVTNPRYNVPPTAYAAPTGYREYNRQPRISLLHSAEYGNRPRDTFNSAAGPGGGAPIHHVEQLQSPVQGQQPFKKIRLSEHKELQPIRIDTREQQGTYNPQVEAISPTLPDHIQQEEQTSLRTTKDELLQQISKVDREIAKTENQISNLKKKEQELEEKASKPEDKSEVEEDTQPKHQSLAQKIYAENRKRAQSAHAQLDSLGPKVEWPIYNQPSDTAVYHENKRKHQVFKRRLLDYFKNRHSEKESRNSFLTETYSRLMQEWMRNVDKIESSRKRKAKDAKNREFFEKVFPELRKQREDKERFNRVGARIKSEADLEEIMDNLQEQALEDKKMRSYAVIPPILFDTKERKITYQNNNGYIDDMEAEYKSRQYLNVWTPSEKEIFKEKYLQHPKNFGVIASYLDRKSVADCVQYYYLSKKTENYKQLLRKSRLRARSSRNNPQKVNSSTNTSVIDIMTTRVQTRLQREQQQKTVQQQSQEPGASTTTTTATTTVPSPTTGTPTTATSTLPTTAAASSPPTSSSPAPASTAPSVISTTTTAATTTVTTATGGGEQQQQQDSCKGEAPETAAEGKSVDGEDGVKVEKVDDVKMDGVVEGGAGAAVDGETQGVGGGSGTKDGETGVQDAASSGGGGNGEQTTNVPEETKKKSERRKDKENSALETSEDEAMDVQEKGIHGLCIVCNAQLGPQLQSRPLAPSQASQYGLKEDQVPPNGRVCNTCRCKCVRSRYTHCPLPTCPNSRGRVKRLRSFPQRLQDLPPDVREPLLAEFHVPSGVTKCCSACFNRIQRRLGPVEEWPEEDVGQLRTALTELGANWQLVGERLNKSAHQVRSYYAANRKRLNLEGCLGDRKPTLTDEEESGSSTSSCEEPMRERHSSDTASAESPQAGADQPANPVRKEDYDSSATETADERQTPEQHYQGSATITLVNNDGQPRQNTSEYTTVNDIMINVIEFSLMKNSGAQQVQRTIPSNSEPTLSSILKEDSNEITIVGEYNVNSQPRTQRNDLSLAKLVSPLIDATITPVSAPLPPQKPVPPARDDLVVLQVQDGREAENVTLDLSIKKPREPPPQQQQQQQVYAKQIHRSEPYYQQDHRGGVYVSAVPRMQAKLPSPKPANPRAGSITQGTPIISQPRYEGLLRQMAPDPSKMGSITQGTPIHVQDKRVYDYYNKRAPVPQNVAPPPPPPQQQQQSYAPQYRQPAYTVEQQLSSRQIIMNDYITSQQMLGRRNDKPPPPTHYHPPSSPHRTPPPPQPSPQQQQQQRQGVIQRHIRPHYPPGHEAFSSLVDVAVQQPSLPVPSAPHEGLGKTMADNIMEQPHRFHLMQQQQVRQQQRMEAERRAAYQQQQQQQQRQQQQQAAAAAAAARSDSSTLTAASLIDAIITHQINQTAEGGREMAPNAREPPRPSDLLFQRVHQDNNGERSPPVINVDLESSEKVNKNLTVKELTDSVISHDFSARQPTAGFYHLQDRVNEQWKHRMQHQHHQQQQQQQKENKRSATPQQDERQIIRIAQPQKYHVEPVSPPENNHWAEQNFRRYQQPQSHISAFDYVKNRIVEVMRTEDDKKEASAQDAAQHAQEKERSDSPGEMVIDEEKHESEQQQQQQQSGFPFAYVTQQKDSTASENARSVVEPKPLLSEQYEPLSDED